MKTFFTELFKKVNKGPWPLIITLGLLLVGTITVYQSPRSLTAFLTLMLCPLTLYFSEDKLKSKDLHWASARDCNCSSAWYSQHLLP